MNKPTIAGTVPDNGPVTSEIGEIRTYLFFFFVQLRKENNLGMNF